MVLHYKKISEEEDKMRNVVEKGEYAFIVKSVMEKKTKDGRHDMLEVELGLHDGNGREVTIKDWIVFMDEMAWKFRHFAATCELLHEYESEAIEARDFLGKNGVAKIGIYDYEKDGEKRKGNKVIDYLKPLTAKLQEAQKSSDFIDCDIPL